MTLLAFLELYASSILISGVFSFIILGVLPLDLKNHYKNTMQALRGILVDNVERLFPKPLTMEHMVISRLLLPYFAIISLASYIKELAVEFGQFTTAIGFLLTLLFILCLVYAVPIGEEWDPIIKSIENPVSTSLIILKIAFLIDYFTGKYFIFINIPEVLLYCLMLFPYSSLYYLVIPPTQGNQIKSKQLGY